MTNISKMSLLDELLNEATGLKYGDGKVDGFKKRAIMIIKKIFGETSDYVKNISDVRFSPSITYSGMDNTTYVSTYNSGRKKVLTIISVMIEDLQLTARFEKTSKGMEEVELSNKIFIVHGHNEAMKQSAARFLEKFKFEAIILHEQANQGKTIIEKFAIHSDASFAIVLLSADDLGFSKDAEAKNAKLRARQNVIFELGYFLGKLGRERVVVLHESADNFEFPSDYQGVVYIPFDSFEYWKLAVLKEMKTVGYIVDANGLL